MLYEIGLFYPDKETDVQVKIPNIPIPVNRRRFFFGGKTIPHWNEDTTNTWVKVPILNGTTKIYLDDSATKDLSNGDDVFPFFDDFDSGKDFKEYGNVITGDPDGSQEISVIYDENPQILTSEQYVFKAWYRVGWSAGSIYYAESTNGIDWVKYASNPILSDQNYYCPYVFKNNSAYYLYVTVGFNYLVRFHSTDGISWINDGTVLSTSSSGWDSSHIGNPSIWIENTTWYMLYEASDGSQWRIGLATSNDGLTWNKSSSNPVLSSNGSVGGPDIHKIDNKYYCFVHQSPSGTLPTDIYLYSSNDLINWQPEHEVLPRTTSDEGAGTSVGQAADPSALSLNGKTYLFFTASSDGTQVSGNAHIKLATINLNLDQYVKQNFSINLNKWNPNLPTYNSGAKNISLKNSTLVLEETTANGGASIVSTYKVPNNNFVIESKVLSIACNDSYGQFRIVVSDNTNADPGTDNGIYYSQPDHTLTYTINGTSASITSDTIPFTTAHKYIQQYCSNAKLYINSNVAISLSNSAPNYADKYIRLWVYDKAVATLDYLFVHKYLPIDPKVLYIRPYHHWWLFETFGGITKLFRASVLEALTKNKSNKISSNEQNTQAKDNLTNVTEENAKEKKNVVNSLEENTQSNITEASVEEGIANVANIITDSIESIINEFDFATSPLEQISNIITDKASAIEANTQNKEFVISTLEKMINEFDFYASACELVQNTIEAKINANEQLTHIKDGKTSTNEQIAYMYEFLTNALENTIKTAKSETTSKETLTKQITDYINSGEFLTHIKQDKISTNEQIAYAYIFATNTLEQISNIRKDIASVQEKLANNQIDIANALEEIYHIDLSARPIFLSSLKAIGTLTTHIKKVF